jgi:hypothetical protein
MIVTALEVETSQSVQLAAWALKRAVGKACSSLTLQEGLYEAYRRDLCWLESLQGVPSDLQVAISAIVCDLRTAFGVDAVTGDKSAASTLGQQDAVDILTRLQAVSSAAKAAAVHHE